VAGAGLAALPNVYYEKVLKTEGQNQWTKNVQLTFWISLWLVVIGAAETGPRALLGVASSFLSGAGSGVAAGEGPMAGITGLVWLVTVLQGFKCLLIPATLKYGDNILYAYAKPASILLTALVGAAVSQTSPSPEFVLGAASIIASMWLYNQPSSSGSTDPKKA